MQEFRVREKREGTYGIENRFFSYQVTQGNLQRINRCFACSKLCASVSKLCASVNKLCASVSQALENSKEKLWKKR